MFEPAAIFNLFVDIYPYVESCTVGKISFKNYALLECVKKAILCFNQPDTNDLNQKDFTALCGSVGAIARRLSDASPFVEWIA